MAQYPGPDIATFKTFFTHDSGRAWSVETYWHAASAQLTQSNAVAAATAYHSQFAPLCSAVMHETAEVTTTRVRVFLANSLVEGYGGSPLTGGLTDQEALPLSTALVIQRKTPLFGRSNQGRIFIGGLGEDLQNGGYVVDGMQGACKAIATFLGADRTFTVPFNARHWNRKSNIFQAVSICFAVGALKSRRDRQLKVGSPKIS